MGGLALKFRSPQRRNVTDRIVLLPGARVIFVELKAPGEKPTKAQAREHARLQALGFRVDTLDSDEAVVTFIHGERARRHV